MEYRYTCFVAFLSSFSLILKGEMLGAALLLLFYSYPSRILSYSYPSPSPTPIIRHSQTRMSGWFACLDAKFIREVIRRPYFHRSAPAKADAETAMPIFASWDYGDV